eukprot:m.129966 g.129966  ORF g.129966 m.129966 type:complete len:173 (+) comp16772_c0_seq4:283-801(+)
MDSDDDDVGYAVPEADIVPPKSDFDFDGDDIDDVGYAEPETDIIPSQPQATAGLDPPDQGRVQQAASPPRNIPPRGGPAQASPLGSPKLASKEHLKQKPPPKLPPSATNSPELARSASLNAYLGGCCSCVFQKTAFSFCFFGRLCVPLGFGFLLPVSRSLLSRSRSYKKTKP